LANQDVARDHEDKVNLERLVADAKFSLSKAQTDNEDLIKKLELNERLYKEAYSNNEKILSEFENTKESNYRIQKEKDAEIKQQKKDC